jgi:V8-like Glu-specific endopeptidase
VSLPADVPRSFEYGPACEDREPGPEFRIDGLDSAASDAANSGPGGDGGGAEFDGFEPSFAAAIAGEAGLPEHVPLPPGEHLAAAQLGVASTTYPWSSVVLVLATFPNGMVGTGTGVMVGRNDALTAGHVVFRPAWGGAATAVEVLPAAVNGPFGAAPYGRHPALITYVDTAADPEGDGTIAIGDRGPGFVGSERDMAFLSLRTPLGDWTQWMGIDPTFRQGYANLSGYPDGNGNRLTNDTAYAFDDFVDAFTNYYYFESYPGMSGSPIWHFGADGRPAVVALASSALPNGRGAAAYDVATNYAQIVGWIASNDNLIA